MPKEIKEKKYNEEMWNEKMWRDVYKKKGVGICMSPSWLLNGCPVCGHKKWEVTSDAYAYCKGCSIGIPTDFPFCSRGQVEDFPKYENKQQNDWEDEYVELYGYLDKYVKGIVGRQGKWISALLQKAKEEEKEKILMEYKEVQNKIDKSAFATFYGMKVKENPYVPKDEIWIGTKNQKIKLKL